MNNSYSVEAILTATGAGQFTVAFKDAQKAVDGVTGSAKKSTSGLKRLAGGIAKVAGGIGVTKLISAGFNAVRNSIDGAVTRVDTLNQFPRILQQMGYTADEASSATDRLSDGIQGLPTRLDEVVATTQRFVTAFGDVDLATESTLALNNALLASGADAQGAANATDQYVKTMSSGKLEMDTWNTLSEQMSYGLSEVAKDLGFADGNVWDLYDSIQAGDITLEEFNQAMIEASTETGGFAETALTASEGLRTSWKNVQTAITTGVANVIQAVNDWMKDQSLGGIADQFDKVKVAVQGAFRYITSNVPVVLDWFVDLFDTIKNSTVFQGLQTAVEGVFEATKVLMDEFSLRKAIDELIDFTGAWAPLVAGIASAIGVIGLYNLMIALKSGVETIAIASLYALDGAQKIFNTSMGVLGSTIGKTVIIVGLLVMAGVWLYQNWDMVSEKAQQLGDRISEVWSNIKNWIGNAWDSAIASSEAFAGVIERLKGIFSNFGNTGKEVWQGFKDSVLGTSENIKGAFSGIGDSISGLWGKILDSPALDYLATGLEYVIDRVVSFKDSIVSLVKDFDIEPLLQEISAFIPKLISLFVSKKAGMLLAGGNLIKMIAEGMGLTVPELFEQVTEMLVGMIEQFAEALPQYVEMGTEMLIAFIDGIVAQIPMLTDVAINIIMTIVEGLLGSIIVIVEAGIGLITSLIEGIVSVLPQLIESGLFIILALVGGIISMLPVIIEVGITLLMTLVEAVIGMLPILIETGITLLMALIQGIITVLPILIETGITLLMALIETIITLLPIIIEVGITLLMALIEGIISMLPVIIDAGITLIMALIEGLIAVLPALIEAGITLLLALVDAFIDMLPVIIDAGVTILMALIGGIIQVLPALISAGFQLIVALGKAIISMIPTIISAGVQILWALIKGIVSIIGQLISAGAELMTSLLSEILSFLGEMLSAGADLIVSLIDGIIDTIGGVVTAVGDGMTNAWNEVMSFGSKFKEAGSNIIGNIASGISGAIGKVTGAIGNVLQAARNLIPFSPPKDKSSPMVGLEKNGIVDNIAQGIYNNEGDIQKAMSRALNVDMPMMNGRVEHEMNNSLSTQPAYINVNIGGQNFRGFVENISNEQGRITDLELQF